MCNSIAEGGGRCAAHIEAEIKNHRENYTWEVIKAAKEDGVHLPEPVITEQEEKAIQRSSAFNEEHKTLIRESADASVELNQERSKYAFALSSKDEMQVARYLYESSDAAINGKTDLAKAQKAYQTRIIEIQYNAEAQAASGVPRQEARTPNAAFRLKEAERIHAEASREELRAEDKMMRQMRDAEAHAETSGGDISYDQDLIDSNKRTKDALARASSNLTWAKREFAEAEDFDRRNFHAVFNADEENKKAKKQYKEIQETILARSRAARSNAVNMAPYAIRAYIATDKDSLRIPQGPEKGKLPEGLRRKEAAYKEAVAARDKSDELLQKKTRRELIRDKTSDTLAFQDYARGDFNDSKRGKEYVAKNQRLANEFGLTEKYEKQQWEKVEKAKAAGKPFEGLQNQAENVRRRRTFHQLALKNAQAKALING
jgi:hypothetical protein